MNQQKSKLFRPLFNTKQSYRAFKKAYAGTSREKRLMTIATAEKIKAGGAIRHFNPGDQNGGQ